MECEMPEFYNERRIKARRPQRCCETGREIPVGAYYWRCVGKWDGDLGSHAQSESAYHFARYLNLVAWKSESDFYGGCVVPFGGVDEAISETPKDDPLRAVWRAIKNGELEWTAGSKVEMAREAVGG